MELIPELNDKQLDRVSEFLSNLALLVIASLIIPNLVKIDKPNSIELILGLMSAVILLLGSLILIRKDYD